MEEITQEGQRSCMILTEDQANQVWEILVAACGASFEGDMREQFVYHAQRESMGPLEFRFQGELGFGGKVYLEKPPRVAYYPEDQTAERDEMVEAANEKLCLLWGDWESDKCNF